MKTNSEYFLQDYCCLRIPAKPVESLLELNEMINGMDLDDHNSVIGILEKIFSDTFFQEAIFTASKDLHKIFIDLQSENFNDKENTKKFLITFYKYFSRMCHRATPYGLFAGVTSVIVAQESTSILFEKEKYRTVCQLNIHSVTGVMRNIDPLDLGLKAKVKYFINKTLYQLGERIFFVEQFNNGRFLASNLTSIRLTEYVQIILNYAKDGATIIELVENIPNPDIDIKKKEQFINSLIKAQVLVGEYWPSVSTDDFMIDFVNYLEDINISGSELAELKTINNLITQIRKADDISLLRKHINNNSSSLNNGDFFKVNLFYNMSSKTINKGALQQICDMAYEISQLIDPRVSESLSDFIRLFNSKYEGNEVPLVQALDPNYGIGFGKVVNGFAEFTPLLEDIPVMSPKAQNLQQKTNKFEVIYRSVMNKFMKTKDLVINIDDDIQKFYLENKDAVVSSTEVNSTYVFGSILAKSAQSLDEGEFKFYPVQLYAPFAARLISRFAHGDSLIKKQLEQIVQTEQSSNPDVILAEVLTIPDDKYANVNLCPTIREYEIPYLSNSRLEVTNQISISDLLVSIKNGRIVLRSAKLNREIIPCLSNTYNIELAQPIYKFLASVSGQNVKFGEFWNWGSYNTEPYLPRVEYKKLILSRARWLIKAEKIENKSDAKAKEYILNFRNQYCVPRHVVLAQGDNELLLDLDNSICRSILIKEINKFNVLLFEHLFTPDNCFIKEDGKGFTNEIIIPLGTNKSIYNKNYYRNEPPSDYKIKRTFFPGSEWLYVKIYSGSKNIEKILTEVIGDFAKDLIQEQIIDKWFFLRYNDPEHHLRVRFHRHDKENNERWYRLLENLQSKIVSLIKEEYAIKIVTDTYTREIERYGEQTMELSENVFFADSTAISNFLSLIYGDEGEALRWKFAFVNIDSLLNDFGYDTDAKSQLIKKISDAFLNEFSHNNRQNTITLTKSMNNKSRKFKTEIADIMENNADELKEAYDCFKKRSSLIKQDVEKIKDLAKVNTDSLLNNYIHMSLNRLFLINQRRHELVVYYLLAKYYESVIAKSKNLKSCLQL